MHHVIGFQIIEFLQGFAKFLQIYTRGLSYSLIILACFNNYIYCSSNGDSPVGVSPMDPILEFNKLHMIYKHIDITLVDQF